MQRLGLSLLGLCTLALFAAPAEAQLFRRQVTQPQIWQQCGPDGCPAIVYAPPLITQRQPVATAPAETAAVVADIPHVRCIAGNSCGSGTICGGDADGAYVVTNAHVAGTTLGRSVAVDCVVDGNAKRVTGRTVMAGYSDSRMVDFCILYVEGLSSKRYMPMLKTEPANQPFGTTGAPRCVWPLETKAFTAARNYGDGLITGSPNAIGGQSGSAIYNSKKQQIALLTWSINGRCAGQKTSKLWQVATTRNVLLADERPQGLVELADPCSERPETKEGIFGACDMFETQAGGGRPITENTISNVVGSAMEDLPIWVKPEQPDPTPEPEPDPIPDCPPCPDCDNQGDCVVLTANEKALIEFIRNQPTADGEKAMDWAKLVMAILEIIRLIQEGRAGG